VTIAPAKIRPKTPQWQRFWRSTVGKKAVMAVTGAGLLLYVLLHMLANLKIFLGRESLDGYGVWLRSLAAGALGYGGVVWLARAALLLAVVLHMTAAIQLARRARKARPEGYQVRVKIQGSYSARTMRWGGVLIALFVVYHVLDITAGVVNPHGVPGVDYANIVADFQRWYLTLFYVVAVTALGFHVRHGMWAALRSLGVASAARARTMRMVALGTAVLITTGFAVVPLSVYFGLVR
jgi:succinate dehydrogenase / fumarate reductase cytochrome b subunit